MAIAWQRFDIVAGLPVAGACRFPCFQIDGQFAGLPDDLTRGDTPFRLRVNGLQMDEIVFTNLENADGCVVGHDFVRRAAMFMTIGRRAKQNVAIVLFDGRHQKQHFRRIAIAFNQLRMRSGQKRRAQRPLPTHLRLLSSAECTFTVLARIRIAVII